MGFFANIPKPPKLAGFFGSEEEGEKSDGANTTTNAVMEEIGGEMEDLELEKTLNDAKVEEVDIPSTSSEQKLLTPMDLLNAARSGGGNNNNQQQVFYWFNAS